MRDDELDGIFSGEQGIAPSSGFTASVMDAVRREASAPAPIPFPWKRVLPGLVLCVLALAAMSVAAFTGPAARGVQTGPSIWTGWGLDLGRVWHAANAGGLVWVVLALLLTLVSVKLALRLAGRGI